MEEEIYLDYIETFGYAPKNEYHLQSFAKYENKSISWYSVQNVI